MTDTNEEFWYDAKTAIAVHALPLLTDLRDKHIGFPGELLRLHNQDTNRANDAWTTILSQIVWSLETVTRDLDLSKEEYEERQRGFNLLGRWFGHLWD